MRFVRAKAPSPLRSAGAVQNIWRVDDGLSGRRTLLQARLKVRALLMAGRNAFSMAGRCLRISSTAFGIRKQSLSILTIDISIKKHLISLLTIAVSLQIYSLLFLTLIDSAKNY
jgi:hypothetical protein